jgi:hypothetical protein
MFETLCVNVQGVKVDICLVKHESFRWSILLLVLRTEKKDFCYVRRCNARISNREILALHEPVSLSLSHTQRRTAMLLLLHPGSDLLLPPHASVVRPRLSGAASAASTCFTSNYLTHPTCPNSSPPLKCCHTDWWCRRNSSPGPNVAATGELDSDVDGPATRFGSGVSICCSLWPLSFPGFRHWGEGWPSGGQCFKIRKVANPSNFQKIGKNRKNSAETKLSCERNRKNLKT